MTKLQPLPPLPSRTAPVPGASPPSTPARGGRAALAVLLAAAWAPGCGPSWTPPPVVSAGPTAMSAHEAIARLDKARALALAPDATDVDARAYAEAWRALADAPPPGFEPQPEGREVLRALDAALLRVSAPAAKVSLQRSRAAVSLRLGNQAAAVGALRAALAASSPSPTGGALPATLGRARLDVALTLVPLLAGAGMRGQVAAVCKQVFPSLRAPDDRFALLDACYEASGAGNVQAGLAWAPPEQRRFYLARRTGGGAAAAPARRSPPPRPTASEDRSLRAAMKRYRICQSRCRSLHSGCMDQACMDALTGCLDACEAQIR